MLIEITVLTAIVIVVGVLTELRPGKLAATRHPQRRPSRRRDRRRFRPQQPSSTHTSSARSPSRSRACRARRRSPCSAPTAPPQAAIVQVDGAPARACGAGCYRAPAPAGPLHVSVDGRTIVFNLPATAPDGRALLARVRRAYAGSRTIVFDETLGSGPTDVIQTRFRLVGTRPALVSDPRRPVGGRHRRPTLGPRYAGRPLAPVAADDDST